MTSSRASVLDDRPQRELATKVAAGTSDGKHIAAAGDDEPTLRAAITSGSEFDRHKVANCRCRNEVFSNVFVAFRCVRGQLSADDAEQAFTIWVENT